MMLTQQIAKHLREVHFGGNWTVSSLKEHVQDISWEQATTKIEGFNTIAVLVFHMNYFVDAVIHVLKNEPLNSKDEYSFDHPPIHSEADWQKIINKALADAETCATLIEQLPDERMWEVFVNPTYQNYYRNLHGLIEHTHYHLGQLVLVKKLVLQKEK